MPGNEDRSQVTKAMMHEQDTQSPARFLPCSHHGVSTAPEVTSSGSGLLWPKLSHPFGALGICHNLMYPFTHISSNTETPWRGITCLTEQAASSGALPDLYQEPSLQESCRLLEAMEGLLQAGRLTHIHRDTNLLPAGFV